LAYLFIEIFAYIRVFAHFKNSKNKKHVFPALYTYFFEIK